MKKILFKIFILFIFLNLFIVNKALAATLTLTTPKNSVGLNEQFYVDLMLDTNGESINTIKSNISFTDNISLLRIEDNKSIVSLWLEKPILNKSIINFTGLMPNGFSGVVDPFNPNNKLPGSILRLVFEANKTGRIDITTSPFDLNLNNGEGTPIVASSAYLSLNIDNIENKVEFNDLGNGLPELEAYVTRNPNIYGNKYILIFKASDKESGIKNVILKEGFRNWEEVVSPYILKDQHRHSNISIQATSNSGASVILNINGVPYNWNFLVWIIVLFIIIFCIVIYTIYLKRKRVSKIALID